MVYRYHSFLIHSSADGHLGCFHVLAMINSAAMNIGVHVSLSDLVSLVYTQINLLFKKYYIIFSLFLKIIPKRYFTDVPSSFLSIGHIPYFIFLFL